MKRYIRETEGQRGEAEVVWTWWNKELQGAGLWIP